jgi:hypothetical protein
MFEPSKHQTRRLLDLRTRGAKQESYCSSALMPATAVKFLLHLTLALFAWPGIHMQNLVEEVQMLLTSSSLKNAALEV